MDERDDSGRSALFYCMENIDTKCVDLLKNADACIDLQDNDGYTSLHLAVIAGNTIIVEYLVENGADINLRDANMHSVIHWAVVCGHSQLITYLLKNKANPETPDIFGVYPIHYASQLCGEVDIWDEKINRDSSKSNFYLLLLKKLF